MNKYGLLGKTLHHSLSPNIHNLIFENTELSGEYALFPTKIENVEELIEKVRTGEIKGLNVTIPYKVEVIKYLDGVSEEAEFIGAVNTICMQRGKLVGLNTDSYGFKDTLITNGIEIANRNVAILGTGGASKSVEFVVKHMEAKVVDLFSRKPKEGQKSYNDLTPQHNYDVIINTTPVGMFPDINSSPIKKEAIGNAKAVVDLIYNPVETKLLSHAKELNKKHINGMYMLVAQAVKSQEIFNAIKIDEFVTQKIYEEMTEKNNG